jgi:toxin ParE1/3/4
VSLTLRLTPEARHDVAEAIAWFRERSPGLPQRFRVALEKAYLGISERPEMHPLVYKRFRRALLQHFPYSIFYMVLETSIVVVGVVHQAQHPSTWKRRD